MDITEVQRAFRFLGFWKWVYTNRWINRRSTAVRLSRTSCLDACVSMQSLLCATKEMAVKEFAMCDEGDGRFGVCKNDELGYSVMV